YFVGRVTAQRIMVIVQGRKRTGVCARITQHRRHPLNQPFVLVFIDPVFVPMTVYAREHKVADGMMGLGVAELGRLLPSRGAVQRNPHSVYSGRLSIKECVANFRPVTLVIYVRSVGQREDMTEFMFDERRGRK